MVVQFILTAVFAMGLVAMVGGLAYGVGARLRDHRTPEERWADEHGTEDQGTIVQAGPQTLWFGTGL